MSPFAFEVSPSLAPVTPFPLHLLTWLYTVIQTGPIMCNTTSLPENLKSLWFHRYSGSRKMIRQVAMLSPLGSPGSRLQFRPYGFLADVSVCCQTSHHNLCTRPSGQPS